MHLTSLGSTWPIGRRLAKQPKLVLEGTADELDLDDEGGHKASRFVRTSSTLPKELRLIANFI